MDTKQLEDFDSMQRSCLINGVEYDYHFCSKDKTTYDNSVLSLKYLGFGTICKINGKFQSESGKYHFWAKTKSEQ